MVWSLSKDDDGLDSVLPLADDGKGPTFKAPKAVSHTDKPLTARSIVGAGSSSTVVVDPRSQVPESLGSRPERKRGIEQTLVLKGRKLDHLRAEVARQRNAHNRKKQRTLLLWAVAGGAALCLGWAAGMRFRPAPHESRDSSTQPGRAPSPIETLPRAASQQVPHRGEGESTFSLDELPGDSEAKVQADPEEASAERKNSSRTAPSPQAEGAAFTLDDLPAD